MKVGQAKFGSQKKFFKFEDGDNVYRILPALGELADKGIWSKYYKVCWGYKNSEGRTKLFQDPRVVNRETKMVEVESAAFQRIEQLKAKQAELKAGGADKATMDKMQSMLMRFNIEGKHHVNAVNLNGEIGLLKIGHKAKMALDAIVKKLREEEGLNVLGIENGLYVNFSRTGRGRDTLYQVNLYMQKVKANVNGQETVIEQRLTQTMNDAFISRLDQEAFELSDMYPAPTGEEVEAIVNGGPEALDAVMEKYKKAPKATVEATVEMTSNAPTTTVTVEPSKAVSSTVTEESVLDTASSTVALKSTPTVEVTAPVAQAAAASTEMSDEDFLKSIGAN